MVLFTLFLPLFTLLGLFVAIMQVTYFNMYSSI